MDITLYLNKSQRNVVNKALSHEKTLSDVFLLEECDVIKPSLIFAKTDDTIFDTYNYAFIPKFNRYYYCTIRLLDGERYQMNCEVDVLMSFKDDILRSEIVATRSGDITKWNKLIRDDKIKNLCRSTKVIRKLSGGEFLSLITPNSHSVIINTIGGTTNNENN